MTNQTKPMDDLKLIEKSKFHHMEFLVRELDFRDYMVVPLDSLEWMIPFCERLFEDSPYTYFLLHQENGCVRISKIRRALSDGESSQNESINRMFPSPSLPVFLRVRDLANQLFGWFR
ncbi:MAG: hypothetical protein ACYCSN_19600 [Acidobacteriaceae bacterium]